MEHTTTSDAPAPKRPWVKDIVGIIVFVVCVYVGTVIINTYVFRSFSVSGRSMEKTMHNGDRLIVNRIPITIAQLQNKAYVPNRGQIIVFKNPHFNLSATEEYIIKRVIAFPGERVTLKDGQYTIYNTDHPQGFNPDDANHGEPGVPTTGLVDEIVPANELFVSGDNREGAHSLDSRNGLGHVPYYDIIGPVSTRFFPFDTIRMF